MHTRGSFEGFKQISSNQKWLYTHGQPKWDVYYSDEAKAVQTAFFDHFLKGVDKVDSLNKEDLDRDLERVQNTGEGERIERGGDGARQ